VGQSVVLKNGDSVDHMYLQEHQSNRAWSLQLPPPMTSASGPASFSNLSGKSVRVHFTHREGHILYLSEGPESITVASASEEVADSSTSADEGLLDRRSHQRSLSQSSTWLSTFGAPTGSVSMIVFIMDLSSCGTGMPPATTPQVGPHNV
jgi:hypothetical protein